MTNRFDGDPAVKITADGAKMLFVGGQPIMDQGFHNAAQISTMTEQGYWGDALETDESKKIGQSDFLDLSREAIKELETITLMQDSLKRAYNWMIEQNIANQINPVVLTPNSTQTFAEVKISPQGENSDEILLLKNGTNWLAQINSPSAERMKDV